MSNDNVVPKRPVVNFGPYPSDRNTSVEVAIWENEIDVEGPKKKIVTYNVTVKRSYRDGEGKWHANQNFRPHDLPVAIHGLQQAYSWILEKKVAPSE